MTDSTRTALDGALELIRNEGYCAWGFCTKLTDNAGNFEFETWNNTGMSAGKLAIATTMALKFMRKRRTSEGPVARKSPLALEN